MMPGMSSLKVPAEPKRPAITPVQIGAALLAGVPIIANLLSVFGVYTPSQEEQDALTSTMQWALGAAGLLAGADAYLRGKRNDAHAHVVAAVAYAPAPEMLVPAVIDPDNDPDEDGAALHALPATSWQADPKDTRS